MITDNLRFIAGKSLELFADKLPDDQISFSLTYAFTILKEGDYWILIGGTPPGSVKAGVPQDWFSPYWISIDGSAFQKLTHESMEKAFPNYPKNTEYVPGGYHWTRIGSHFFTEGRHKIEIKVMDRRKRDGKYVMYLDAIFLAPKGWKPVRSMSYLSNELFLDHAENNLNS